MSNIPTTIYLDENEQQLLQAEAQSKRLPLPELIRAIIVDYLSHRSDTLTLADYMGIVSLGQSGLHTVAENHDEYVAQAIADEHLH